MTPETLERFEVEIDSKAGFSRREFVVGAASGFMLQFCLPGLSRAAEAAGTAVPTLLNSYILIGTDNTITVQFGGCELGQGAMSGFCQILAEDLMVDWSQMKVQTVPPGANSYITGGSSAIKNNYLPLRRAGAAARMMLIQAAATAWGAPVTDCYAASGVVHQRGTNHSVTYGYIAPKAAVLTPPANVYLVPDKNLRLIGKPLLRLDLPQKTNGSAVYGLDIRIPNMVYAVIRHCPSLGGTLASTPQNPGGGVIAMVPLGNAVAAVAGNTWDAMTGLDEANIRWNIPASSAQIDSTVFAAEAAKILASGPFLAAEATGNVTTGLAGAKTQLQATYNFPYLAHACMEVLNCTVNLTATTCEIWAPTQAAAWVQGTAAALTGLPPASILVHTTLLGGGLGRKIEQDYIAQAVQVAMAVKQPVKMMWPREEDFGKDQYRPMAVSQVTAGLDASHNIVAWRNRIVTPSILAQRGWISAGEEDGQATEGSTQLPYAMSDRLVEWGVHPSPVPIGFWRSVGNSYNIFVLESFIDELANLGGLDPYLYRRQLLANNPRFLRVLDAAATLGEWTTAPPTGHYRGIAIGIAFGTVVAEVVEISNATATSVNVVKVACAVDCGRVINPDSVTAQMQGGIVHGLSSVLWGSVTFTNGVGSVKNFSNYRMLTLGEMPQVTVELLPSTNAPTGAGEPGVPPLGPALANAYFKATGVRVRTLPFFPGESHMSDG